jgi:hypothetical protein
MAVVFAIRVIDITVFAVDIFIAVIECFLVVHGSTTTTITTKEQHQQQKNNNINNNNYGSSS